VGDFVFCARGANSLGGGGCTCVPRRLGGGGGEGVHACVPRRLTCPLLPNVHVHVPAACFYFFEQGSRSAGGKEKMQFRVSGPAVQQLPGRRSPLIGLLEGWNSSGFIWIVSRDPGLRSSVIDRERIN
jgi:hypothetical protein